MRIIQSGRTLQAMHESRRKTIRLYVILTLACVLTCCDGSTRRLSAVEIARKDSVVARLASVHNSVIEGKTHINYVFVSFAEEVFPRDTVRYYDTSDIPTDHRRLRKYLSSLGDVIIQKSFPKALWGDTVRMNSRGEEVVVPNLARNFRIFFLHPMPKEVMDSLKVLPEIRTVSGPAWISLENVDEMKDETNGPKEIRVLQ